MLWALTSVQCGTYHRRMRQNAMRRLVLPAGGCCFLLGALLCGCDDAGKKPAQAHVPGQTPARAAVKSPEPIVTEVGTLPPPNVLAGLWISLQAPTPGG